MSTSCGRSIAAAGWPGARCRRIAQEPGVAPASTTETFVALRMQLDSWRWAGVPFYLRTGKRLPKRTTEIAIQFRRPPLQIFKRVSPSSVAPNLLIINVQPDEGISVRFEAKLPATRMQLAPVMMNFRYGTAFGGSVPEAYETLLLDAMLGDPTLFARHDFVESSWALDHAGPRAVAGESGHRPAGRTRPESGGARKPMRSSSVMAGDGGRCDDFVARIAPASRPRGRVLRDRACARAQRPRRREAGAGARADGDDRRRRPARAARRSGRGRRAADRRRRPRHPDLHGTNPAPTIRVLGHAVALEELRPEYLNNAVAALRLSSLPTVVWWRGGNPEMLEGVAHLADRMVFDAEEPADVWARAAGLAEHTAISDLRWARLTRWRALMAQFFDIPAVREAAASFNRLVIEGADRFAAQLYGGWLSSSLHWSADVAIELRPVPGGPAIQRIELGDGDQCLSLRLGPSGRCVEASARVAGHTETSRVVSLGDQRLTTLICEELRIRSRDLAFERAVAVARGIA